MTGILNHRLLLFALRVIIGGIFVYAGAAKFSDPQAFADSIATFKLLPPQIINILALSLPPFEIIIGIALLIGVQTRATSFALIVLTLIFAFALIQALARGLLVDCGCFGSGEPSIMKTVMSLARDFLLLFGCIWIYRFQIAKLCGMNYAK